MGTTIPTSDGYAGTVTTTRVQPAPRQRLSEMYERTGAWYDGGWTADDDPPPPDRIAARSPRARRHCSSVVHRRAAGIAVVGKGQTMLTRTEARNCIARLERYIELRFKQTEPTSRARDRVIPLRKDVQRIKAWFEAN